jgi:hypothetical protein
MSDSTWHEPALRLARSAFTPYTCPMNAVIRARLAVQHIARPIRATPLDIVRHLLAVQAQDYIGAKWGVGLRIKGATDAAVDRAVNAATIVRTHVLRPTWHFVAAEDIRWLLAITGPRVIALNAWVSRKLGLDARKLTKALRAMARTLEGGAFRTRDELRDAMVAAGVAVPSGLHLAYYVMHAEQVALICNGPRRGKQFTYALMDERVPATPAIDDDEALGRLAARFVRGHGPASTRDLARWASLPQATAKRAVEIAGAELVTRTFDGTKLLVTPDARRPVRGALGAQLLCIYDEYFAGFKDRAAIITPADERAISSRGAAVREGFLIDGRVRGTWAREFDAKSVSIALRPFGRISATERSALRRAVEPYARFFGVEPVVRFEG